MDWNYPPAFPSGAPTSGSGHLATPDEVVEDEIKDIVLPENIQSVVHDTTTETADAVAPLGMDVSAGGAIDLDDTEQDEKADLKPSETSHDASLRSGG